MFARVAADKKEAPSGKTAKARGVRSSEDSAAEQETEGAFAPARFSWSIGNVSLTPLAGDGQPNSYGAGKTRGMPILQASSPGPAAVEASPTVHQVLATPGRSLDPGTRGFMERRFDYDFSGVRVHSDPAAEQSARDINANAYTVGQNIVFGAGHFAPHHADGRRLLAHELAHVVQQGGSNYPAATQGKCEQDANDAARSVGNGLSPVVRTSAVSGGVQRQAASPVTKPATQKKSRLVRVERYWRSTSGRAFFEDGSNEEVTFVQGSSLDPATQPEGAFEKVVNLIIDRSSLIRPKVEIASHASGSKVKVITRLSPSDRIAKLPGNVRADVSQAFLGDPEIESNPETMEFAADMGDRLDETSSTTKIEMRGRDPQTLARMQAVDQWVGEQKSTLDKLGATRQAKFTQLLGEIRQVGVTGTTEAEDLDVEDIELVLAGAAGGQSDFQSFAEFKRGMEWKLRSGRVSPSEEMANNPDFAIRNEYRKAWKAEAAGLRKMSRIAEAAQVAPFAAIGVSAAVGGGAALGGAFVAYHAARGISLAKWVGTSLFASKAVSQFVSAREEARAAGIDPNSPLGVLNTASAGLLRAGGGKLAESVTDTSLQTGKALNLSASERASGAFEGALDLVGTAGMSMPESPGSLSAGADSRAAKAGAEVEEAAAHPEPNTGPEVSDQAAPSTAKRSGINWNPFRGKSLSEYLPSSANETAMSQGKDPVTFKGLTTTAKGGRVWVSTDEVDHYHVEDLVTKLMRAKPGDKIEIITGTHGTRAGNLSKEFKFLLEDYGIAPASNDLTIHDVAAISDAELKSILLSDREVVLAWCDSEFSRRIVVALGMNLMKAPF